MGQTHADLLMEALPISESGETITLNEQQTPAVSTWLLRAEHNETGEVIMQYCWCNNNNYTVKSVNKL